MIQSRHLRAFFAPAVALTLSASADAALIRYSDFIAGNSTQTFEFDEGTVTVRAVGGSFAFKNSNGVTGLGVSGGSEAAEIDGSQHLIFEFSSPVAIDRLRIGHLFASGLRADVVDEAARFRINDDDSYTLTAETAGSASWSGDQSVDNVADGCWEIDSGDIFGETSEILMRSANPGSRNMGDFSFQTLEFEFLEGAPVPAPAATLLLALVMLGSRRRRGV